MARTIEIGAFQGMQRGDSGAEQPSTDARILRASGHPIAEQLQRLGVRSDVDPEMALGLIRERVRAAAEEAGILAGHDEISAEAERIWASFGDQRGGARVATVETDGTIRDWRRPDTTPDRGPDVGETHHTITDDEPRFSGGGAKNLGGDLPFKKPSTVIPSDSDFNGKPYREASELATLADDLIEKHGFLEHLQDCNIRYWWKRKTGTIKRQRVLGGIKRGSDLFGQLLGAEFAIFLAADTARERQHTDRRVERSLFRQLRRIGQDDKGNWIELPFTIQLFTEEIQQYADLDDEDLRAGRNAYRTGEQLGLFDSEVDEEDEDLDDQVTDDGAGVLIHADGSPMTLDEIADMEAAEERG